MADSTYEIEYKKSVEKDLRKLPASQLKAIVAKIQNLATEPHPNGSVKLHEASNLFRIRHTDYRVVYQVINNRLIVLIVKVGHRREVYREP
ncbi:MAG TPA: type II toxin-antitoxin system RelE/ParE family toxin [Candidatus Saccharimonadales bacterium]|nr:type II toxin-antitoxin system RelE/ParE family toxin [Candidatus Saccharimonadales bacterium]